MIDDEICHHACQSVAAVAVAEVQLKIRRNCGDYCSVGLAMSKTMKMRRTMMMTTTMMMLA
jgi:hypothetical protein